MGERAGYGLDCFWPDCSAITDIFTEERGQGREWGKNKKKASNILAFQEKMAERVGFGGEYCPLNLFLLQLPKIMASFGCPLALSV